jgi:hypothetical protein
LTETQWLDKRRLLNSLTISHSILIVSFFPVGSVLHGSQFVSVQQTPTYMPQTAMYGNYMPQSTMFMGGPPLMQGYAPVAMDSKGKGKSREADFEAAFSQAASFMTPQASRIVEVEDGVTDIEEAFKSATLDEPVAGPDFKRQGVLLRVLMKDAHGVVGFGITFKTRMPLHLQKTSRNGRKISISSWNRSETS